MLAGATVGRPRFPKYIPSHLPRPNDDAIRHRFQKTCTSRSWRCIINLRNRTRWRTIHLTLLFDFIQPNCQNKSKAQSSKCACPRYQLCTTKNDAHLRNELWLLITAHHETFPITISPKLHWLPHTSEAHHETFPITISPNHLHWLRLREQPTRYLIRWIF